MKINNNQLPNPIEEPYHFRSEYYFISGMIKIIKLSPNTLMHMLNDEL